MKLSELQELLLVRALVFWLAFDCPELILFVNFAVILNPYMYYNFTFFDCFPLCCFHSGSYEIEKLHSTFLFRVDSGKLLEFSKMSPMPLSAMVDIAEM